MKARNLKRILCLLLALLMMACVFTACKPAEGNGEGDGTDAPAQEINPKNESDALVLQTSTFDGIFSPFFYSNAYDGDAVTLVSASLLGMDVSGAIIANDDQPTVAKSYEIYYTDAEGNKTEEFEEGGRVVYDMVIKNGMKFSDGTPITAEDVLFNYYVYLDPAYDGSSTLYTQPILGLDDYQLQVADSAKYMDVASAILAAGKDHTWSDADAWTQEQQDFYWTEFDKNGAAFAQAIIDYVKANYLTDEYTTSLNPDLTAEKVGASEALTNAYGMAMWNFGSFESATSFKDALGTTYDLTGDGYPTAEDYFAVICAAYENDYATAEATESAGPLFIAPTAQAYAKKFADGGKVESITGLTTDKKTIDGEEYDVVRIILTRQDPKAILSLGVVVAPKAYYTNGYTYTDGAVVTAGVELNSTAFMDHLKSLNGAPVGAGTYKMSKGPEGNFYENNIVYFERNEYFETMGGKNVYNATIKNVRMAVVTSGAEYDALEAGTVMYATVSATSDVMDDLATSEKLDYKLVDNNGYGYICINPKFYTNINTRIALTTLFNLEKVYDYYPNGLAEVIYRAQSKVSWAYPEGATAMYPYDETTAAAKTAFEAAGYTFTDGKMIDPATGEQAHFVFTLPSDAAEHPAGQIFINAGELLTKLGATSEIKSDENLIANIKTEEGVGIYALAWSSAADPDMYQVYHKDSQADSVQSNGIAWLAQPANGGDDYGKISITKLDNTTVEMNQSDALNYLAELIEDGTKYMLVDERAPIYSKALDVLAELSIEIPTYQRKNLFVFDKTVIDGTTLSAQISPYWGPLAEVWKVSFTK